MTQASFDNKQKKTIVVIVLTILGIVASTKIYNWVYSQTTDNAYLDADITLVSPEVSGVVTEVLVKDYQTVKKGDVIAYTLQDNYKEIMEAAEAQLLAAKKKLEVIDQQILIAKLDLEKAALNVQFLEVNFDVAKRDYNRSITLEKNHFNSEKSVDETKRALSKADSDLKTARLTYDTAGQQLKLLGLQHSLQQQDIRAAENNYALKVRDFNNTTIKAPISGTIADCQLKIGRYIRATVPVVAIVPTENLYVRANFKETQIKDLKPGMELSIRLDSVKSKTLKGKIRSLAPATGTKFSLIPPDNATGNFTKIVQRVPVIIDIEVPKEMKPYAKAGVSVTVHVSTK